MNPHVCLLVGWSVCHNSEKSWRGSYTSMLFFVYINRLSPEEHEVGLEDVPEVVVPVDGSVRVEGNVAEHLHSDDGIDEEEHHHQHHHVWKSLQ